MTSTTSLASRPAVPSHLTTTLPSGAGSGATAGPGRSSDAASTRGASSPVLAARTVGAGKATGAKASGARKTTAKKPAGSGTTAKGGYAKTSLSADYAFLRDPKLSFEEKLSRFIGLLMAKAENDLLAQMEKMAGGAKAGGSSGSSGTSGTPGTGGAAAPRKAKGFSVWGVVKVLLPQVGMASKVLGEAATKKLVQQLSGPVLAAAATGLGFPMLAPVALQAGKALGSIATDDQKGAGTAAAALGGLVASTVMSAVGAGAAGGLGGAVGAGQGGGLPGSVGASDAGGSSGGGASKAAAGGPPSSTMADQLEFQRLMERQKETFTILSNILRMNHEARMTSIQNLR